MSCPYIVLSGVVGEEAEIAFELRRRGFITLGCNIKPNNEKQSKTAKGKQDFFLEVSDRLKSKLCEDHKFSYTALTKTQLLDISYAAIGILQRTKILKAEACWIACDYSDIKAIMSTPAGFQIPLVNDYFGPRIATYFCWLHFYTTYLTFPTTFGVLLSLHEFFLRDNDSPLQPWFIISISIWSSLMQKDWEYLNTKTCLALKTYGIEDYERSKDMVRSLEGSALQSASKPGRTILTTCVIILFIYLRAYVAFKFDSYSDFVPITSFASLSFNLFEMTMYIITPLILSYILEPLADLLNNFEDHSSNLERNSGLMWKSFILLFYNRFFLLFYVAFYKQDFQFLRLLIAIQLLGRLAVNVYQMRQHVMSSLKMLLLQSFMLLKMAWNAIKNFNRSVIIDTTEKEDDLPQEDAIELLHNERDWNKRIEYEKDLPVFEVKSDYLEMIIQYGDVVLFALVFPLGSLIAMISNMMEYNIDMTRLLTSRRTEPDKSSTIGIWKYCLDFISYLSVISNCGILYLEPKSLGAIVPMTHLFDMTNPYIRFFVVVCLEHSLLAAKFLILHFHNEHSEELKVLIQKSERSEAENSPVADNTDDDVWSTSVGNDGIECEECSTKTNKRTDRVIDFFNFTNATNMIIDFTPFTICMAIVSPLMMFIYAPMWIYIPAGIIIVGYYHTLKQKQDYFAALAIIGDCRLIESALGNLPDWVTCTNRPQQKVEWFNTILSSLWLHFAAATENAAKEQFEAALSANCPQLSGTLEITRFTIGSDKSYPKIEWIKLLPIAEDEDVLIRMEIEMRWAGNPHIVLQAAGLPIELSDVRFAAIFSIELYQRMSEPPFCASMSVTCMKKPFLHFSLSLASLDVVNSFNSSGFSITGVINSTIQTAMCNTLLYPKKIIVPLHPSAATDDISACPIGILNIVVESIKGVSSGGMMSRDPCLYVECKTLDHQSLNCEVNPVWKESDDATAIDVLVYNKSEQHFYFTIYSGVDYQVNAIVGKALLMINDLKDNVKSSRKLIITVSPDKPTDKSTKNNNNNATMEVTLLYSPLQTIEDSKFKMSSKQHEIVEERFLDDVLDALLDIDNTTDQKIVSGKGNILSTKEPAPETITMSEKNDSKIDWNSFGLYSMVQNVGTTVHSTVKSIVTLKSFDDNLNDNETETLRRICNGKGGILRIFGIKYVNISGVNLFHLLKKSQEKTFNSSLILHASFSLNNTNKTIQLKDQTMNSLMMKSNSDTTTKMFPDIIESNHVIFILPYVTQGQELTIKIFSPNIVNDTMKSNPDSIPDNETDEKDNDDIFVTSKIISTLTPVNSMYDTFTSTQTTSLPSSHIFGEMSFRLDDIIIASSQGLAIEKELTINARKNEKDGADASLPFQIQYISRR